VSIGIGSLGACGACLVLLWSRLREGPMAGFCFLRLLIVNRNTYHRCKFSKLLRGQVERAGAGQQSSKVNENQIQVNEICDRFKTRQISKLNRARSAACFTSSAADCRARGWAGCVRACLRR
jgi:hypothetical protein